MAGLFRLAAKPTEGPRRLSAIAGAQPPSRRRRRAILLAAAGLFALLCVAASCLRGVGPTGIVLPQEGPSVAVKATSPASRTHSSAANAKALTFDSSKQLQHLRTNYSGPPELHESTADSTAEQGGRGSTAPAALPLSLSSATNLPLCRRRQIADGTWVPEHLPEAPYLPPFYNKLCGPTAKYTSPEGWDTYKWVPNDSVPSRNSSNSNSNSNSSSSSSNNNNNRTARCHFTEWNRTLFCELIRHATVMIVGDSLSWENCASLMGLLGTQTQEGYQHMSRLQNVNVGHAVCGGTARVVYRRDDDLSKVRDALFESGSVIPQVLVLNRGAHYQRDEQYVRELRGTLNVVEEWLHRCDQLKIKCHFFWRTTVPGHHHCQEFKAPVNDVAAMEAHVANLTQYTAKQLTFHWDEFRHQNLLALEELQKRRAAALLLLPHRILDGYRINIVRPDQHYDCLHSCYPGKMDVYAQIMLHYLRADRTDADVDRLRSVYEEQGWNVNVNTVYIRGKGPT
jgi:hypothetical protein